MFEEAPDNISKAQRAILLAAENDAVSKEMQEELRQLALLIQDVQADIETAQEESLCLVTSA